MTTPPSEDSKPEVTPEKMPEEKKADIPKEDSFDESMFDVEMDDDKVPAAKKDEVATEKTTPKPAKSAEKAAPAVEKSVAKQSPVVAKPVEKPALAVEKPSQDVPDSFDDSEFELDDEEENDDAHDKDAANIEAETKQDDPLPQSAPKAAQPTHQAPPPSPIMPSKPLSLEDIPLSVVVEIGRIQMPVKRLLELQPGNMLDLPVHPEMGVDLVVNGKRIARGELLRIGDVLGIRIMEL